MPDFFIEDTATVTLVDNTPENGILVNFMRLDNGFNATINGVDLFVGGPGTGAQQNELEFQTSGTPGQTVRFADGEVYGIDTPEIWEMRTDPATDDVIVELQIFANGTIKLSGAKFKGGPLEPLELFNGLTVNTAAIAAAWNDTGTNEIVIGQLETGPTNATGEIVDIMCFTSGTIIEGVDGPVQIEDMRVGDLVLTYDNGYQPIRWIGTRQLSADDLAAHPNVRPIRIRAHALGQGFPAQDLTVSPQHRVLVSSVVARRMFETSDVLIPAKKLLPLDGVDVVEDASDGVAYVHMLFDTHQIVWSNGTPTESLFTGPEALRSVSAEARQEIEDLFADCMRPDFAPTSARYIPKKGKLMHKLVERHQINDKPLFDGRDSL